MMNLCHCLLFLILMVLMMRCGVYALSKDMTKKNVFTLFGVQDKFNIL